MLARVHGVEGSAGGEDPAYLAGLSAAVSAALDYGFAGIEGGEERAGPTPTALLGRARQAAHAGVSLDVLLRRYFVGYTLLGDFLIQAAEDDGIAWRGFDLQRVWRAEATLFDRLIAAISAEYAREAGGRLRNGEQRRTERVKMLLAGELVDADDLQYEFDTWHIGAIAAGPGAALALRDLAAKLDRRLLLVRPEGGTIWAWMGGQRKVMAEEALGTATTGWPVEVSLALGETARGLSGWRQTHRQARAAAPIALRLPPSLVRYTDVALLASALQDDVLADSLEESYLAPLADERDGGAALRETLCAYFAAGRNVSCAAAALEVSRQTVNTRLRAIEQKIGRPLDACTAEMETALRLRGYGLHSTAYAA